MFLYLNSGFGSLIGERPMDQIANFGFCGIRQDYRRGEIGKELVREFCLSELRPMFLIAGGKTNEEVGVIENSAIQCARYCKELGLFDKPDPPMFDIINEPNLSPRFENDPTLFAVTVIHCLLGIRNVDPNAIIISGGISNTDRESLDYLEKAMRHLPPASKKFKVGFHTYHHNETPVKPHKGFESRDAEMQRLKAIAGERKLVCTEIGRTTAPQKKSAFFLSPCFKKIYQETDEQVADYLEWELTFLHRHGVELAVIYQHRDGPNPKDTEDRFGIFTQQLEPKPVAYRLRDIWRKCGK